MKNRSIYDNPYKYAIVCNVPFDIAKIACKKQRHLDKEHNKHKAYCPKCGSKHLEYEMGSYEEGYGDFIECSECGETFDLPEVPNVDYMTLSGFEDFDAVLYFSTTGNKSEGWVEACGAKTLEEWQAFARRSIVGGKFY